MTAAAACFMKNSVVGGLAMGWWRSGAGDDGA